MAHRLFCSPPSSTENLIIPFAEADNAPGHVRGTGVGWKKREEEEVCFGVWRDTSLREWCIVTIAQETGIVFIAVEWTDIVLIGSFKNCVSTERVVCRIITI